MGDLKGEKEMTSVYVVSIDDCESSSIVSIHLTKEGALKTWNDARLQLIEQFREYVSARDSFSEMYERMLKNLDETNPEIIDNYPHECPHMVKHDLVE